MKFTEDKLEELDAYFAPKKESEKWLFIFGIAGIIAYLGYLLFLPYTEEMHNVSEKNKHRLEKNIADNKMYLNSITQSGDRNYRVKQLDEDIKRKKHTIVTIRNKTKFINSNLDKLSDMLFNQRSWSVFLNTITQKAEIHNINLAHVSNKYVDNNGSFGHVLEIGLGASGNYKNIVRFMNELEQNVLVTDIYETKLMLDNNSSDIKADIHISVWGINH